MYKLHSDIVTVDTDDDDGEGNRGRSTSGEDESEQVTVEGTLPNSMLSEAIQNRNILAFQVCFAILRNEKRMNFHELTLKIVMTIEEFDFTDLHIFLQQNAGLISKKRSFVELTSNLSLLSLLLKLSGAQSNLKSKEHNNYSAKNGSLNRRRFEVSTTSYGFVIFEHVFAVVLNYHLSLKLNGKYFLIPFIPSRDIQVGDVVLANLSFFLVKNRVYGVDNVKSCVICDVTKISKTANLDSKKDERKIEKKVELKVSPPNKENKNTDPSMKVRNIHDIKQTVLVHLLLSQSLAHNLRTLYSKMRKPYKKSANFSCFKEELDKCHFFGIHQNKDRNLTITLKKCLGLEFLIRTRGNVSTVENKKKNPAIPICPKPLIKVSEDKETLYIKNLKANISRGKALLLRLTENTTLKIETKHLRLNLDKGVNQSISLVLNLKKIYEKGDCLVEMTSHDEIYPAKEKESQDEFVWNEELQDDFATNPFLSSPNEDIVNLCDSDSEEFTDSESSLTEEMSEVTIVDHSLVN